MANKKPLTIGGILAGLAALIGAMVAHNTPTTPSKPPVTTPAPTGGSTSPSTGGTTAPSTGTTTPVSTPPASTPVSTPPASTPVSTPPASTTPVSSTPASADKAAIGMNLSAISAYSTEDPFIDRMKTADAWSSNTGAPVQVDADGWPLGIPAGAQKISAPVYIGTDIAQNQGMKVRVSYDGEGSMTLFGGGSGYAPLTNGGTVTLTNGFSYGAINIDSDNAANPVRNLKLVRTDQAAAYDAGEIFNSAFLDHAKHWSVLRFMDWNKTNGNTTQHWSDRTKLTSASWSAGVTGVPIEAEVALANKVHADPWLNVPAEADDDFVRQMVTYVRDHLDPTLKLHLENSNEVWNGGFQQNGWSQQQAQALWPGDQNLGALGFYGYRSAQIAAIARQVYGADADKRLAVVISSQTAWLGLESYVWNGVAKYGTSGKLFDEWAITTYWGGQLGDTDAAPHTKVMGWVNGGSAGIDAALAEIEHGGGLPGDNSLDSMKPIYAYQAKVAASHGLKLVGYEGGFYTTAFATPMQDHQPMVDFFGKLQADQRMGPLYTRMAKDFAAAGGTELTVYNDVGGPSIWGTAGTVDNLYATSARWDAMLAESGR